MSIPNSVFCNCLFFPIIDSCSHFARYFYTTRKDRAVHTILLAREERHPSCATIPSFLFKVASYSAAIIRPCAVFVIWSQSLSHLVGKKKKKKQPVLLKPLSPHFCIRKFTEWFSNDSSYCDYTFAGQILGFLCPPKPNKKYGESLWRK